jgi:hypothetical protein
MRPQTNDMGYLYEVDPRALASVRPDETANCCALSLVKIALSFALR